MSEDLDDLLRRAMKTLEDQVPPGYFDELPKQTLARLEDSSMHDERNDAGASQSGVGLPAHAARSAPSSLWNSRLGTIRLLALSSSSSAGTRSSGTKRPPYSPKAPIRGKIISKP